MLDSSIPVGGIFASIFTLMTSALPRTSKWSQSEEGWQEWSAWFVKEMVRTSAWGESIVQTSSMAWCDYTVQAWRTNAVVELTLTAPARPSLIVLRISLILLMLASLIVSGGLATNPLAVGAVSRLLHSLYLLDLNSDGNDTTESNSLPPTDPPPLRIPYPTREQMSAFHLQQNQHTLNDIHRRLTCVNYTAATSAVLALASVVALLTFVTSGSWMRRT